MDPIAFSIFGLEIRWYGILIATGIVLAMLIAKYTCKVKNINYENFMDAVLIALPFGIIGARLYYVIFNWDYYGIHTSEIINIRQGGLAIHGGILLGFCSALIYTRIKKLNFLSLADAAAPCIIMAQAIGRWGNFFNREAHGDVVSTEFISHFPRFIQSGMYIDGVYYNPTFLYESIWSVIVATILIYLIKRVNKEGTIFFLYIGLYSIGRFFIEGLRTDSLMIGPLRTAQVISLFGLFISICFFSYSYYKNRKISKSNP
jgi:phosphatidylglycerol:prolipoprotein diacylglycerol transferase